MKCKEKACFSIHVRVEETSTKSKFHVHQGILAVEMRPEVVAHSQVLENRLAPLAIFIIEIGMTKIVPLASRGFYQGAMTATLDGLSVSMQDGVAAVLLVRSCEGTAAGYRDGIIALGRAAVANGIEHVVIVSATEETLALHADPLIVAQECKGIAL